MEFFFKISPESLKFWAQKYSEPIFSGTEFFDAENFRSQLFRCQKFRNQFFQKGFFLKNDSLMKKIYFFGDEPKFIFRVIRGCFDLFTNEKIHFNLFNFAILFNCIQFHSQNKPISSHKIILSPFEPHLKHISTKLEMFELF